MHILKKVVKVVEEKFKFLCFSSLPAIRYADPPWLSRLCDPQIHLWCDAC